MENLSIVNLLKRVKAGDKSAFDQLFRMYYMKLRNYSFHITIDINAAEDIVQTLFYNLWQKPELIENIHSLDAYLRTSTYNRSISYLKDKHKFNPLDDQSIDLEILQYHRDIFIEKELSLAISHSVEKLPEQCRLVFKLSRNFGMKNMEIASYLGISLKGVEKHITRALHFLRDELKDFLYVLIFLFTALLGSF
jgi:RNA polymerase sigma-70 factor, ECF subfamily